LPRRSAAEDGGRLRVLVVEDNWVNQKIAVRVLGKRGHDAATADDGRQALERFRQERFDLVLMDIQMPEMDGYEAARLIRTLEGERRRTPIIALTAFATPADRTRCFEAGMDAHLAKPIDPQELDRVIREVMSQAAPQWRGV
jgi:CheY-like chemotaxis protein